MKVPWCNDIDKIKVISRAHLFPSILSAPISPGCRQSGVRQCLLSCVNTFLSQVKQRLGVTALHLDAKQSGAGQIFNCALAEAAGEGIHVLASPIGGGEGDQGYFNFSKGLGGIGFSAPGNPLNIQCG